MQRPTQTKVSQNNERIAANERTESDGYAHIHALSHRDDDPSSVAEYRFVELLESRREFLMRGAVRLMRNSSMAEDLVQETLLRAYKARSTFAQDSNMSAWLSRIQRNTFINNWKKEKRRGGGNLVPINDSTMENDADLSENGPGLNPERIFFQSFIEHGIRKAVDELPDRLRVPFVLREFDGLAYDDVSRSLGIPIGTIKSRLFRARAMMRVALQS